MCEILCFVSCKVYLTQYQLTSKLYYYSDNIYKQSGNSVIWCIIYSRGSQTVFRSSGLALFRLDHLFSYKFD